MEYMENKINSQMEEEEQFVEEESEETKMRANDDGELPEKNTITKLFIGG